MPSILCDLRERRSGIPEMLSQAGLHCELRQLPAGDYVLSDRLVVERKSAADLVASIKDRRLHDQVTRLKEVFPAVVLVVEGRDVPFPERSWRSAVAAVMTLGGVSLLPTETKAESAEWIELLARRETSAPSAARLPHRKPADPDEVLQRTVMMLPGVSAVGSARLLGHFGTLQNLVAADEKDLRGVPGIGAKRAAALSELFQRNWIQAPEKE